VEGEGFAIALVEPSEAGSRANHDGRLRLIDNPVEVGESDSAPDHGSAHS
jgi:hypothetical protein